MIFLNQISTSIRKATSNDYDSIRCTMTLLDAYGAVVAHIIDMNSRVIDGYHEFLGVEELVRAYMLQNNISVFTLAVKHYYKLDGDAISAPESSTLGIVYTGAKLRKSGSLTADVFTSYYFLTHYKVGFAHVGQSILLSYYAAQNTSYSVVHTKKDNTTQTFTGTANAGVGTLSVSGHSDDAMAVVTMGNRTFTVYYLDMDVPIKMRFRNVFNAVEYVSFPGSTNKVPKTEFETAQIEGVSIMYDIEQQLELKIKSAALPSAMYNTLLDLCRSRKVEINDPFKSGSITYDTWNEVLIKEYKLEESDNPNTPISIELTLQYADKRNNDAVTVN